VLSSPSARPAIDRVLAAVEASARARILEVADPELLPAFDIMSVT
jgi:hypothetical protein